MNLTDFRTLEETFSYTGLQKISTYGKKKANPPKVPRVEVDSALGTGLLPKRPPNSVDLKIDMFSAQKCFC